MMQAFVTLCLCVKQSLHYLSLTIFFNSVGTFSAILLSSFYSYTLMLEEKLWLLISLKLSGEASPEELTELQKLLQDHPDIALKLDMLENVWKQTHPGFAAKRDEAFDRHFQRLSDHLSDPILQYETEEVSAVKMIDESSERKGRRWWVASAVAAAITIFLFLFFLKKQADIKKEEHNLAQNSVSTKPGSKSKIQLPDGTQVWLNADSKIAYNENFLGNVREVQLTGEAYFDVVKDKSRPFIIHTHAIDLKVLGTAFNVRSYDNEQNAETSLIRGSIEVTLRNNPDKKIVLKPNEKLVVHNDDFAVASQVKAASAKSEDGPMMVLSKVHFQKNDTIATETLWLKNKLVFDSESLENVALKIERWYDVKVTITDEKLKKDLYHAIFEDESLQQVLDALSTNSFRFTINKKDVTIKPL